MCLTLSSCLCCCLYSNVKLGVSCRPTGGGYLHVRMVGSPTVADIFLVFRLGINICTYYIITVLYVNSWLTS